MAGFPHTTAGVQLNRMCGSSQQAVHFAAQAIAAGACIRAWSLMVGLSISLVLGDMECAIACGVEMMSVVPMGSDSNLMSGNSPIGAKMPFKVMHQVRSLFLWLRSFATRVLRCLLLQGQSAEMIAEKYGIAKADLDKLAGVSHEKAAAAIKKGIFKKEILPITIKKADGKEVVFADDEGSLFQSLFE